MPSGNPAQDYNFCNARDTKTNKADFLNGANEPMFADNALFQL
jgi:hypothetical protein